MSLSFSKIKKELDLLDVLDFGKYNGAIIQDVIEQDPTYIGWAYTHLNTPLSEEVVKHLVTHLCKTTKDRLKYYIEPHFADTEWYNKNQDIKDVPF